MIVDVQQVLVWREVNRSCLYYDCRCTSGFGLEGGEQIVFIL